MSSVYTFVNENGEPFATIADSGSDAMRKAKSIIASDSNGQYVQGLSRVPESSPLYKEAKKLAESYA